MNDNSTKIYKDKNINLKEENKILKRNNDHFKFMDALKCFVEKSFYNQNENLKNSYQIIYSINQ